MVEDMDESVDAWLERFAALPKVELHVHLEGAVGPRTFWELAARNGVELPASSAQAWESYFGFRDFEHFIQVYTHATSALRSPEDYHELVVALGARQAAQNIVWTEAFVSLSLAPRVDDAEFVDALCQAKREVRERHGVVVELIGDISRHEPESRHRVLELVRRGVRAGAFAGLGLGGSEAGHPPELFADVYEVARREGLVPFAHAGETGPPAHVAGSIDVLGARRIGHGIRVLEDPELVKRCAALGIPFEVCPTSNVVLGVVDPEQAHPIHEMVRAGLVCTVCTDDPAMFECDLVGEYRLLARQGMSVSLLSELHANGVRASMMPEDEKRALLAEHAS